MSPDEVKALPMSGNGWNAVSSAAKSSWGSPCLADLNCNFDVNLLAGALYAVRTGDETMRTKVANGIYATYTGGSENGSRALEISRNLQATVIAADLIGYRTPEFENWLRAVRGKTFSGKTIVSCNEDRPNNWGTHCGAARIAIARYLGDTGDLAAAAKIFHGWLGARSEYASFEWGNLSWQSNKSAPVGINPMGATIDGYNVDGVLPDDQRRSGTNSGNFTWPPPKENYVWEALQGASVQATMLTRAGYPAFEWENKALYRAANWLFNVDKFPPDGDDQWIPWVINKGYGVHTFPAADVGSTGKNMGFTNWTHR